MNDNLEKIKVFKKFLEGKMDSASRELFEQELESDENLFKEFKEFALSMKAVELERKQNVLKKMIETSAKREVKLNERRRVVFLIGKVAAVILPLAMFYWIYTGYEKTRDQSISNSFYSAYFKEQPDIVKSFYMLSASDTLLNYGLRALEENEYNEAINYFNGIRDSISYFNRVQLLKGYIYIKSEKYNLAREIFDQLLDERDVSEYLMNDIEWYNLLSYVVGADFGNQVFEEKLYSIVSRPNHKYHEAATKLQYLLNHPIRRLKR